MRVLRFVARDDFMFTHTEDGDGATSKAAHEEAELVGLLERFRARLSLASPLRGELSSLIAHLESRISESAGSDHLF